MPLERPLGDPTIEEENDMSSTNIVSVSIWLFRSEAMRAAAAEMPPILLMVWISKEEEEEEEFKVEYVSVRDGEPAAEAEEATPPFRWAATRA